MNPSEEMKILFYRGETLEEMEKMPLLKVFDEDVCTFMEQLSKVIRKDGEAKKYSDVVTFGFFCRRANIEQLKCSYATEYRIGRGLTFHVAPSNVAMNFAYSMAAALLAGNPCVVRVSTKEFPQTRIMCRLMEEALEHCEWKKYDIGKYIALVTYERKQEITDYLSGMCKVRIIWGGDRTIEQIRKSPLAARGREIAFADRYSLLVLDAKSVLAEENMQQVAQGFYNDTYLFDQNACSSPRLVIWYGEEKDIVKAKDKFWSAVEAYTVPVYETAPKVAVDKLLTAYKAAAALEGVKICTCGSNLIYRVVLKELSADVMKFVAPGGFFAEYHCNDLKDILCVADEKVQTLSYYGMDKELLRKILIENGAQGIDRIVPVGKTADFSLIWDGYDLIRAMSRVVDAW